jgi:hypothetical protein
MGVQLFGGRFYKCVYVDTHDRVNSTENVTNKIDCLHKNFTWENSRVNFDNVFNGYLALFQVVSDEIRIIFVNFLIFLKQATFKGWIEIMADASDAKDVCYDFYFILSYLLF